MKKTVSIIAILLTVLFALTACGTVPTPTPTETPYNPGGGDHGGGANAVHHFKGSIDSFVSCENARNDEESLISVLSNSGFSAAGIDTSQEYNSLYDIVKDVEIPFARTDETLPTTTLYPDIEYTFQGDIGTGGADSFIIKIKYNNTVFWFNTSFSTDNIVSEDETALCTTRIAIGDAEGGVYKVDSIEYDMYIGHITINDRNWVVNIYQVNDSGMMLSGFEFDSTMMNFLTYMPFDDVVKLSIFN